MAVERLLMTAEDLAHLPDDGMRHELIDGELRTMPPASGPHGFSGLPVVVHLALHIYAHNLGVGSLAETGFVLRRQPDRVRAPDFAFIRSDRLPPEGLPRGYVPFPPDMVLEVVSPADRAVDIREKVQDWLDFGCRAVWVLFPGPRLDVYGPGRAARTFGPDDAVDGGEVLPGFRPPLHDLVRPPGGA